MSQIGIYASKDLVQESNLIKHVFGRRNLRLTQDLYSGDRIIPAQLAPSDAVARTITVQLPNLEQTATFTCREDQFILNAALASGLGLPFGCRMGSCGMCCGRLVEGTVERAPQLILTEEQMNAGYALLCRSRPRSDCVITTHQDGELGI